MITVLGPKGGTGKTVTSSNLAVALALEGKSAVLVDLDLQFGDVGLALGLRADEDDLRPRHRRAASLDGDKIDELPRPASLGCAGAAGAAAAGPGRGDHDVVPAGGVRDPALAVRLRDRRHAAGVHARGDRGGRRLLAPAASSGCSTRSRSRTRRSASRRWSRWATTRRAITLVLNRADSSVGITHARRRAAARPRARRARRQRPRDPARAHERPADRRGRAEVEGGPVVRSTCRAVSDCDVADELAAMRRRPNDNASGGGCSLRKAS